jgi:FemAB-related protein (PEP-CTERM system-associated)
MTAVVTSARDLEVRVHEASSLRTCLARVEPFAHRRQSLPLSLHPAWLSVLATGLRHVPYCLEAVHGDETRGFLPLAFVKSFLFGRYLVSLPYLNYGGVMAGDDETAQLLVSRAVTLADQLDVRYLELRHQQPMTHPDLNGMRTDKVHMRLELPKSAAALWEQLSAKVRNQVRKGQKSGLDVVWGGLELVDAFYAVFSRNMRDLGTPVYGKRLFASILKEFPDRAEICLVRHGRKPAACALLLHGWGVTEVPSASSLRAYNSSCANMLLYWNLLERSLERGQQVFDFGRSSKESNTYRFKKQWGAAPVEAAWQYYVRRGSMDAARPDNPRFQRLIRMWQKLPVWVTRLIGPRIVRGIP